MQKDTAMIDLEVKAVNVILENIISIKDLDAQAMKDLAQSYAILLEGCRVRQSLAVPTGSERDGR